jgi:alkylhydroperoxidase/carboxymuconolactone decarboxylase family protein YurZ
MEPPDFTSPREAARPFTPKLSALSESPLYDKVWEDSDLSKRDRSLITVAAQSPTSASHSFALTPPPWFRVEAPSK